MSDSPSSNEMCYVHEIKEVPRYGIQGTIWHKGSCPYCKIERLQLQVTTLTNAIKSLSEYDSGHAETKTEDQP